MAMLKLELPKNPNYCAIVVELQNFITLPKCDNVKAAVIFGNSVIVGKDTQPGEVGLYFPVETALSKEFLGANNLFHKAELGNADATKKGYFEEHGRIKAIKFRGNKSEGFWIPLESLTYTGIPADHFPVGMEFDRIVLVNKTNILQAGSSLFQRSLMWFTKKLGLQDKNEVVVEPDQIFEICHKYIPRRNKGTGLPRNRQGRQPRAEDKIVEGQFHFHIDTEQLRRNSFKILPDMWISISDKWHGSSAVFSNILIKRDLNFFERALKMFGVSIKDQEYGFTWSSRRVVKGVNGEAKTNAVHFYGSDIWGTVAKEVEPFIPKGFTLYGEIVGYTPDGGAIQSMGGKPYHYGCPPKSHRFVIYRITTTNSDGKILELSWLQLKSFCAKFGLEMVKELYFGKASDFFEYDNDFYHRDLEAWQIGFVKELEKQYVYDQMCSHNNNEVPSEGIVVRIERLDEAEAYKLKNFNFLQAETKDLDAGVVDIEASQEEIP